MKLVSHFAAASHSTAELHALLAEAFNAFANAPRSNQDRRDALATMRNIEDELSARARSLTVQWLADRPVASLATGYKSGQKSGLLIGFKNHKTMISL
ncbi:hypothetical protein [Tritonibacter mobilis]|uniref:hypothetical protein n=1 Tax=Tritonibacter mobilis TaxID=379347 RepID=UPI00398F8F48